MQLLYKGEKTALAVLDNKLKMQKPCCTLPHASQLGVPGHDTHPPQKTRVLQLVKI